jgi:hypothetical protein
VELLAPGEAEPEQVEGVGAEALAFLGVRHPPRLDVARLPRGLRRNSKSLRIEARERSSISGDLIDIKIE